MNRRNFITLTSTFTGGLLVLPEYLHAFRSSKNFFSEGDQSLVFIQLNGGNDGLNTFIPFDNPLYYHLRPNIAISKEKIVGSYAGMGFHPALKVFDKLLQKNVFSVIQNVGYPEPNRSHFRSQEIWQTASESGQYLHKGWLGRYFDIHSKGQNHSSGINIDTIDNLALKGDDPHFMTIKDPNRFKVSNENQSEPLLSNNPQLNFVRNIANNLHEDSVEIQKALKASTSEISYPKTGLSKNLEWIARLIKGNLNSNVYYTSLNGFDTHDNQLSIHNNKLTELNDAIDAFYEDLAQAQLETQVTIVIFSEFGRRVKDNGTGTDHGAAAPLFVIGGKNTGKILGNNPNLEDLDQGDLKYQIDFRSVYATLLDSKLGFNPNKIGIQNIPLQGLF